jgi:hypothetical protein
MATTIPAFAKLKMPDQLLQRLQTNIDATLTPLQQLPIAQSVVATFTTQNAIQAGSDFTLDHGLGRAPVGIIPCLPVANQLFTGSPPGSSSFSFTISPTKNPAPASQAILRCSMAISGNASLSFLVF